MTNVFGGTKMESLKEVNYNCFKNSNNIKPWKDNLAFAGSWFLISRTFLTFKS